MEEKTLEYYYEDGTHIIFNNYTISTCGTIQNTSGKKISYFKTGKYSRCGVHDEDLNLRKIQVGRAIASTFLGPPPAPLYTADHIDKNPENDMLQNIRWLCKKGQNNNRTMPYTYSSAFIIIKDGLEKTAKQWVEYLKFEKNHMGREYTKDMITTYANRKHHGFGYKEYPTIPGESWVRIYNSENTHGHWEISDMNRVKYVTAKGVDNVLSGDRLRLNGNGYPMIGINGRDWLCHILAFKSFFPAEYAMKKTEEIILHEDDDKLDFRPQKLRVGTTSVNSKDAHSNGKYDGKKSMRMKCASYVNGKLEKEHSSQSDAVIYLKSVGYEKSSRSGVRQALQEFVKGNVITRYDRTWQVI
jgi:hypothetical protein